MRVLVLDVEGYWPIPNWSEDFVFWFQSRYWLVADWILLAMERWEVVRTPGGT